MIGPCPGTSSEIRDESEEGGIKMDLVDLVIQLLRCILVNDALN